MTQSPEGTSGWVRTDQASGLKHDHMGRYSGEPLKPDLLKPKTLASLCPSLPFKPTSCHFHLSEEPEPLRI